MNGRAEVLCQNISRQAALLFGSSYTGMYVHGSLALGGFRWAVSDIDFIIVVTQPVSLPAKTAFLQALLDLDSQAPAKGLEMSVILRSVCQHPVYPTPYQLHFSNMHKEKCRRDPAAYAAKSSGLDPDLAAHMAVIRQSGIVMAGPPAAQIFGPVSKHDYMSSVMADICDAPAQLVKTPVSTILNLSRTLAYLQTGRIMGKKQGGQWAVRSLPDSCHDIIAAALAAYTGSAVLDSTFDARKWQPTAQVMLDMIKTRRKNKTN